MDVWVTQSQIPSILSASSWKIDTFAFKFSYSALKYLQSIYGNSSDGNTFPKAFICTLGNLKNKVPLMSPL